jgi:hypothetical protein
MEQCQNSWILIIKVLRDPDLLFVSAKFARLALRAVSG